MAFLYNHYLTLREKCPSKQDKNTPTQTTQGKNARIQKLREELERKGRMTNDEAQALLGVSDATATRYFKELEKKGEVVQEGENRGVYYKYSKR